MHNEQIKLKADRPYTWFAKEFISPALLPHARVGNSQTNSYGTVFSFRSGMALFFFFFQFCNALTSKTRNWLDTAWQQFTEFNIRSNCGRCQWPNDPFPFEIFLSSLCRLCSLLYVLMRESKLSRIIWGLEWYVVRCRSIQVLVFSSVIVFVANSSIIAAILIRRLGCVNIEKWIYNFKSDWAGRKAIFALHACRLFQFFHRLEDKRG